MDGSRTTLFSVGARFIAPEAFESLRRCVMYLGSHTREAVKSQPCDASFQLKRRFLFLHHHLYSLPLLFFFIDKEYSIRGEIVFRSPHPIRSFFHYYICLVYSPASPCHSARSEESGLEIFVALRGNGPIGAAPGIPRNEPHTIDPSTNPLRHRRQNTVPKCPSIRPTTDVLYIRHS